jgi:hypothetical protein
VRKNEGREGCRGKAERRENEGWLGADFIKFFVYTPNTVHMFLGI